MDAKEILKLKRELKTLIEQVEEIEKREGKRTKEELEEMNSIMDQIEEIRTQIKTAERAAKTRENLEQPEEEDTETEDTRNAAQGRVEVVKPEPYKSLGETLLAIARTVRTGREDKRLLEMDHETRAATGFGESIPSDGGFLVGKDVSGQFLDLAYGAAAVSPRCDFIEISANSNGVKLYGIDETSRANGSRQGGILSYWPDEADAMTSSKSKFKRIEMELIKQTVLYYSTDELLQDAKALQNRVNAMVSREFAFRIDDAIINGDGAGKPLGILNSNCLISQAKETSQVATTIVYENIIKMYSRMISSSLPRAVWLANADIFPQLASMTLAVGTGGVPVWIPANSAAGRPHDTLLGKPIVYVEACPTLGTVGDLIFADLSEYLLIGKGGIQEAMSIHVRFLNNETVFRFVNRTNGQPKWKTALTPFKGTATVGPFVALATRS